MNKRSLSLATMVATTSAAAILAVHHQCRTDFTAEGTASAGKKVLGIEKAGEGEHGGGDAIKKTEEAVADTGGVPTAGDKAMQAAAQALTGGAQQEQGLPNTGTGQVGQMQSGIPDGNGAAQMGDNTADAGTEQAAIKPVAVNTAAKADPADTYGGQTA